MSKKSKGRFVSVEKSKLEAILNENIHLKRRRERIWTKAWFPFVLLAGSFLAAYLGAFLA